MIMIKLSCNSDEQISFILEGAGEALNNDSDSTRGDVDELLID